MIENTYAAGHVLDRKSVTHSSILSVTQEPDARRVFHLRSSTYEGGYFYDQAHARALFLALNLRSSTCHLRSSTWPPVCLHRKFQADFSSQRLRNFNQASPPPRLRIFLNSQKRNCWVRGFQEPRAIAAAV